MLEILVSYVIYSSVAALFGVVAGSALHYATSNRRSLNKEYTLDENNNLIIITKSYFAESK